MGLAGMMLGSFFKGGKAQPTGKINIDELAEMLGITPWEKMDDLNEDYYIEAGGGTEEGEQEARDEVFRKYHDALNNVADNLFEQHGLTLVPVGKERTPYEFRIVPKKSWADAAEQIRETINGVGMFHFNSLKEFLDSGPYTARQAVLQHLHYIKRHPDVYGERSARDQFERAYR